MQTEYENIVMKIIPDKESFVFDFIEEFLKNQKPLAIISEKSFIGYITDCLLDLDETSAKYIDLIDKVEDKHIVIIYPNGDIISAPLENIENIECFLNLDITFYVDTSIVSYQEIMRDLFYEDKTVILLHEQDNDVSEYVNVKDKVSFNVHEKTKNNYCKSCWYHIKEELSDEDIEKILKAFIF